MLAIVPSEQALVVNRYPFLFHLVGDASSVIYPLMVVFA